MLELVRNIRLMEYYEDKYKKCLLLDNNLVCGIGVPSMLKLKLPLIFEILSFGAGKISMCGKAVATTICIDTSSDMSVVEIYCNGTISEVNDLIRRSVDFLQSSTKSYIYQVDTIVVTLETSTIIFHSKAYKDKRRLLNDIPNEFRHGWNPVDRYFCSVTSGIMLNLKNLPKVDITGVLFEKYVLFTEKLNKDILLVVCLKWLKLEVLDAKDRLTIEY